LVGAVVGTGSAVAATSATQTLDTSGQVKNLIANIAKAVSAGQTARPGQLTQSATCGFGTPSQVFLPWSDSASYGLAPQGDLSSTSSWTLSNTTVAADHDSFTPGTNSLRIAGNGQATSPAMCVDLTTPTIRLFVKTTAPSSADLKVSVLYEDLKGNVKSLDLAKLRAGASWQPSVSVPIIVNAASALSSSGWTAVAFVFKPEGTSTIQTWSIDNLYVDPYHKS